MHPRYLPFFFSIVYQVEPMIGKELESDEEIFSRVSPVVVFQDFIITRL
jgi:hypothetical protein